MHSPKTWPHPPALGRKTTATLAVPWGSLRRKPDEADEAYSSRLQEFIGGMDGTARIAVAYMRGGCLDDAASRLEWAANGPMLWRDPYLAHRPGCTCRLARSRA